MARRKLEQLRDAVVAAAAQYCEVRNFAPDNLSATCQANDELREAVEALNAYLDEIVDSAGEYVEGSPETSRNAALSIIKGSGSTRRKIVDEVYSVQFWAHDVENGRQLRGLTDNDLEHRLRGSHQTVSSARNWLVNAGWLHDGGARRLNPSGRPAVVWQLSEAALIKLKENQ